MNLIQLFTFYLAATFLVSTFRRIRQYGDVVSLTFKFPNRWPKTLEQIKKHRMIFFTWATLRPAILAIGLMVIQLVCSRMIWPNAKITPNDLLGEWWIVPFVGVLVLGMLAMDAWGILFVGKIDRGETEKYLDEAEHWLTSWKAPMISTLTFGLINPRKMVDKEVRKAVVEGNDLLKQSLWLVSLQTGLRLSVGLSLWIGWALLPQ